MCRISVDFFRDCYFRIVFERELAEMKVSFVVPCYCSEATIKNVVAEIQKKMCVLSEYTYEIILVNDFSPDETFEVIKELCDTDDRMIGIDLAKNFGQHAALMAGFQYISGDIVVCLDDDGQTPADEVEKLLYQLEDGYDVVYASYENKQHSPFRNFGSWINSKMAESMLGKPDHLYISSYFAAKRFVIEEMKNYKNPYPYVIGLVLRTSQHICNVTVSHRKREVGHSGYSFRKLFALWINGFTSFSVKPLRIATISGIFVAIAGFIYAVWTIVKKITNPYVVIGWSSTVSIILIIGGMILCVLGMIGEYVGRIYISINNSPQFVIRDLVCNKQKSVKVHHLEEENGIRVR